MYRKEISEKDSHIQVLKLAEKRFKDLSIKIAETKLSKEGKIVTGMVRQCKMMLCHIYMRN